MDIEENIDKSFDLIEQLNQLAIEHDSECEDAAEHSSDCPQSRCMNHRWIMVAHLMMELDLDLIDLGFIADAFVDIGIDDSVTSEVAAPSEEDEVLEAREVL